MTGFLSSFKNPFKPSMLAVKVAHRIGVTEGLQICKIFAICILHYAKYESIIF